MSWAVKGNLSFYFLDEPDVVPGKEMLALRTDPHFAERPPILQRIVLAKESEFAAGRLRQ